jgi:hypothetical protein
MFPSLFIGTPFVTQMSTCHLAALVPVMSEEDPWPTKWSPAHFSALSRFS